MLLLKSLLGGIIGAAAGAGVWAAVTFYSEREFGILAWLVGLLAGGCVYLFVRQDADTPSGLIAALCAAVAVGVGKWITMSWFIERDLGAEAAQEILSKGPKLLLERLDPLDLLFLGLAVFSAYRLGSGGNDD